MRLQMRLEMEKQKEKAKMITYNKQVKGFTYRKRAMVDIEISRLKISFENGGT